MIDVLFDDGKAHVLTIGVGDDKVDVILSGSCPRNLGELIRSRFEARGGSAEDIALWLQGCNWALRINKVTLSLGV